MNCPHCPGTPLETIGDATVAMSIGIHESALYLCRNCRSEFIAINTDGDLLNCTTTPLPKISLEHFVGK